jgi:hypothetical protein
MDKNIRKENIKEFQSSNCNKRFGTKYNLRSHIKNKHENIKEFQCSNCKKQFGTKYNLKSHIKNKHKNIKYFKCDLFGVQFKQEYEFQNHFKNVHVKPLLMHKDNCSPPCFHFKINKLLTEQKNKHPQDLL